VGGGRPAGVEQHVELAQTLFDAGDLGAKLVQEALAEAVLPVHLEHDAAEVADPRFTLLQQDSPFAAELAGRGKGIPRRVPRRCLALLSAPETQTRHPRQPSIVSGDGSLVIRETESVVPETRYTKSGNVNIAYQVVGDGPFDLLCVPGWVSNVELMWEEPTQAAFLERLASFSRLILFDKRGTGLSDRVPDDQLPTLEERMDDVRAVLDAAGSEQPAIFGYSEGGVMSILFAATYPRRARALVIFSTYVKRIWSPDYPWAPTPAERQREAEHIEREWGRRMDLDDLMPTASEELKDRLRTYLRRSASPGAAVTLLRMNTQVDIRALLPAVRVPTLLLYRTGDRDVNVEEGRFIAERIPGARFVELPGDTHIPWFGDADSVLDEIEEFLTGVRRGPDPYRVLATVLFTDIVGATERAAELGDRRWRELLTEHHAAVRRELGRFRGREVDTAGDGFLATFDGPARAIRCACAIEKAVEPLGLELRAGLHTGECELMGDKVSGIAVHTGARVAAEAGPGEVLVSSTVKDLVAGSGIQFVDRGVHALKGVPGEWRLYAVSDA
jgi:pimeloyl-ACP methyl ester carboxylesterase